MAKGRTMGTQRIALVRRSGDGLVQIAAVSDIAANLQLLQSFGVHVDESHASTPTPHASRIVNELRLRFRCGAIDGGPWFAAEYPAVKAALAEYSLESGERRRAGSVALCARVHVDGLGEGIVTGFSGCGRVQVSMAAFPKGVLTTLAPASQVRPL